MTNRPRLTEKHFTFYYRDSYWFQDGAPSLAGFKSQRAVLEWKRDRELYNGEMVTVKFERYQFTNKTEVA